MCFLTFCGWISKGDWFLQNAVLDSSLKFQVWFYSFYVFLNWQPRTFQVTERQLCTYVYHSSLGDFRKMEHRSARPAETFDMSSVNAFWLIPNFHPQAALPKTAGWVQQVNFTDREDILHRATSLQREEIGNSNSDSTSQVVGYPGCQKHSHRKGRSQARLSRPLWTPWANSSLPRGGGRLSNPQKNLWRETPIRWVECTAPWAAYAERHNIQRLFPLEAKIKSQILSKKERMKRMFK